MKNLFKLFVPMAAAVIATLASCVKEDNVNKAPEVEPLHITVSATPDEIQGDSEVVKTYISSNKIYWGTGEYMKIGVSSDGTKENTKWADSSSDTADLWEGEYQNAYFTFTVSNPPSAEEYYYYGLYPASAAGTSNNTNPASYKVVLPSTQNATASSYDPKAYILVAKPEGGKTAANADWSAFFRRATALNCITLMNVPDGVSIKRVEITAPDTKKLSGGRHIDLSKGDSGDFYSGTNKVEIKFETALPGPNVPVWFTSWDVNLVAGDELSIIAYSTDKKKYTKTISLSGSQNIKFQEGCLNTLGANLSVGTTISDATELEDGDYVILARGNNDSYFAVTADVNGKHIASTNYTGNLTHYYGVADLIWNVTKTGDSYIIENDGKYIGYKTSGNEAYFLEPEASVWEESNYLIDVIWDSANSCYHATLHSNSDRIFSRNNSENYFAFYTSNQQNNLLFIPATEDNREAITLAFAASAIDKTTANYSGFTGQTVSATDSNDDDITGSITVTYEKEYDSNNVVTSLDSSTGAVVLSGNIGSATIKATFDGDSNYIPATASYTITVGNASELSLSFSFSSAITGWPAASGDSAAGAYTYTLNSTDYTFTHTKSGNGIYCQTSYLMICSGNYLGLPAIEGYKLASVSATLNSGGTPSTAAKGTITSDTSGTVVTGGTEQTFDTKGGSKTFTLTGTEENTVYYLAISNKNFQCIQIDLVYNQAVSLPDPNMSWSADNATATYNTGNVLSFTAPTLIPGNATGITYESTDETIATISDSGVVSITALSGNVVTEGSTTIKAIFAGDASYKAKTVSYTLSVVDSRATVSTPSFSPAAGQYTSAQNVTISCETDGAAIHYTTDGSAPTANSTAYTSAIPVSTTTTVKAIAVKNGYKDSEIATALYTFGNDGSLEHPYTASEARTLALGGDTGSYYITGIVTKVQNQYSASYGTANFWIDENGASDSVFEGYKIKYFGNQSWVEGNAQIALNDEVIIYGTLTVYNSTTPETSSGYLVSLNGTTKGLTLAAPTITTNTANSAKEITVAWTAATGTDSAVSYVVTCGGQTFNANAAGSHTFTMSEYTTYSVSVAASASDAISAEVSTTATLIDPNSGAHYYTKVTDLSTLSANDVVLIINPNHDALPAFTGTSTVSATDLHTSYYDSTNDRYSNADAAVNACAVTLITPTTAINNKVVFKLKMSNNYYIVKTQTSGTGFNPNTSSTDVTGDWTLSIESNGKVKILNNTSGSTRCIIWQGGTTNKFGAYAGSNFSATNYSGVDLYKLN